MSSENLKHLLGQTPESKKDWLNSKKETMLALVRNNTKSRQAFCKFSDLVRSLDEMRREDLAEGKASVPEGLDFDDIDSFLEKLVTEGLIKREGVAGGEIVYG